MKKNTHPELHNIKATCGCDNVIEMVSTLNKDMHLDTCSACHPFYIGQQKTLETGRRIDKFRSRFGASSFLNSEGE